MKKLRLALGALCALALAPTIALAGDGRAERPVLQAPLRHSSFPKLDSRLAALAAGSTHVDARLARQPGAARTRVVVEAVDVSAARAAVARAGGRVVATSGKLVEALVPPSRVAALSGDASVRFLRPPRTSVAEAIPGEEVAASGAAGWQTRGLTGKGVKVAILDLGFAGLAERQASGDLPATVTTADFCGGDFNASTEHGTAVAEIVHEMAPDAQLYLICYGSEVSLPQALAYAKSQGVQVLNHSVGTFNDGRGDGTGTTGSVAADARASGILWVNSAGNYAQTHWAGAWSDPENDRLHNWSGSDFGNSFPLDSGDVVCGFLKWDEWPAGRSDFDLLLFVATTGQIVAGSANDQNGSQPPTEEFCYQNTTGATQLFAFAIGGYNVVSAPRFDLFTLTPPLEYQTPAGSLADPATAPSVLAVGALCWQTGALEPYSSQGPTIDNRTKPDVAGLDSVSGASYGPFSACGESGFPGTSAAAPEIAGAAVLVKQQNPAFGPNELQVFLERNVVDLGPAGKDNQYGAGRVALPLLRDTVPPRAKAVASKGTPGSQVKLFSQATDESGEVKLVDTIKRGARNVATLRGGFTRTVTGKTYFLVWRAPASLVPGTLRHCVQAIDRAGNKSALSCARLTIAKKPKR